jgi:hypothetical protein
VSRIGSRTAPQTLAQNVKRHDDSKTTRQEHRRSQLDSDAKNHNAKQRDTGRAEKKLNIGPVVHAMSNDMYGEL